MNTVKVQQRGTLTLPKKIRDSLDLQDGDILSILTENGRIIIERTDSHDATLLKDIKQSLSDIKSGKFIEFGSIPEFKKKLKRYDAH